MTGLFKTLLREERAASIVELGLVAPIFSALLVGMVDVSNAYTFRLKLEQSAQRTIEQVMQQQEMMLDYEDLLKAEAAAAADVDEDDVVPDAWLECSTDGLSWSRDPDTFPGECDTSQPYYARYVSVAISKDFTPMFGASWFPGANSNGTITLTGTAGVRVQ